jgi:hypothetical protein
MTRHISPATLIVRNEIVAAPAPAAQRACEDHSFELPPAIYITMGGLFFGFLAVMAVGFAAPGLVVPMGINFVFLTAFFAIPTIFVAASHGDQKALGWDAFMRNGVETATGHSSGAEAAVLTLLLPALIFCFALAVVAIAALV